MKIYVAGCGGMLGEAVHRELTRTHELKCTDIDVNEGWLERLDFRVFEAYQTSVEDFEPDVLIHLGAHTDLEYCERNPDDAYLTNTIAVEQAANIANAHGIPLVYISTAGIFDGAKQLYDDWDAPNPLGVYARSKFLGERIVQERVSRHLVCRAGWMMGGGPKKDKKFINKLLKKVQSGIDTLHVVDDRLGTPTYTVDFACNLEKLLTARRYGLYNMVCGGETGRLEVARELLAQTGLDDRISIVPVSSDYFSSEYFAPRPPSERLRNYKLDLVGLNIMRDWRVALSDYLSDYYEEYLDGLTMNHFPRRSVA